MNDVLLDLFRHKTWATLRLFEFCESLTEEQLDSTTPGTFGTIRQTLRHLVAAEEWYFSIVTGERLFERMTEKPVPIAELAERIRKLGPRWEQLARDAELPGREVYVEDGGRMPAAIPMAQAIHHADDHRTHVLTIIGAMGLDAPEPDVWAYAESAGLVREE
jgi:uncharacterized damage-inducible protein DinB